MNIEFTFAVLITGFLVALTHPAQSPKLKDLEGQFLYLKAAEIGLIAYSLGTFLMLSLQWLAQQCVWAYYGESNQSLEGILPLIRRAETDATASLFWSIVTRTLPILLSWSWSKGALILFNRANQYWKRKTGNPITELLLYYRLAKESSSSRQVLDSLIDITPLIFFLKSGEVYIGLPTLIELCSENGKTPFKELTILPLLVLSKKEDFFLESHAPRTLQPCFPPVLESQIFLSYEAIGRFSVCKFDSSSGSLLLSAAS